MERIKILERIDCRCRDEDFQNELLNQDLERFSVKCKSIKHIYKLLKDTDLFNYSLSFDTWFYYNSKKINPKILTTSWLKELMEYFLINIGFKKIVKDYIIIVYTVRRLEVEKFSKIKGFEDLKDADNFFEFKCEILFDIDTNNLKEEEINASLNNYFNYYMFLYDLRGVQKFEWDAINETIKKKYNNNSEELKYYDGNIIKEENLKNALKDPFNKLLGTVEFFFSIRNFFNILLYEIQNNNDLDLLILDFDKIFLIAMEMFVCNDNVKSIAILKDRLCLGEDPKGDFFRSTKFNIISYKKELVNLKNKKGYLYFLRNFWPYIDEWYEFPRSEMFRDYETYKANYGDKFEENILIEGVGVYKEYMEDVKKEYGDFNI